MDNAVFVGIILFSVSAFLTAAFVSLGFTSLFYGRRKRLR